MGHAVAGHSWRVCETSTGHDDGCILRATDPELTVRVPVPPLGARRERSTNRILPERRKVAFITPIPKPKKQKGIQQEQILFDAAAQALGTEAQQYDLTAFIGGVRHQVDRWRELPDPNAWSVTPETAQLLTHWRSHRFGDIRPFFCQQRRDPSRTGTRVRIVRHLPFGLLRPQVRPAEGSDVDILVRFDRPTEWRRFFGVQGYLENLLGRPVESRHRQGATPGTGRSPDPFPV